MRYIGIVLGIFAGLLGVQLLMATPVLAADDFTTDYNVTYDIQENGLTNITQQITLTNLQNGTYAKEFTLTVSSVKPENIKASQNNVPLDTQVTQDGDKTQIKVPFKTKVIGKDKSFTWVITYDTKDVVSTIGQVRSILIPRIGGMENIGSYDLSLKIPQSFGTPALMSIAAQNKVAQGTKNVYTYTKDQLGKEGISAIFSTSQQYNFTLNYPLVNTTLIPVQKVITLPPTTPYQTIYLDKITPTPDSVAVDPDGNWLAKFTVSGNKNTNVKVTGKVKLFLTPQYKQPLLSIQKLQLTQSQPYWETDQATVTSLVDQLFNNKQASSSAVNAASAINNITQYIVGNMVYVPRQNDFSNRGALNAFEKPQAVSDLGFADVTVTLARAVQIPAREVLGYTDVSGITGLGQNNSSKLHAWTEYYDENVGWVPIDAAWSQITGGVKVANTWDLRHIVLAYWGNHSDTPLPAGFTQSSVQAGNDVQFSPTDSFPDIAPSLVLAVAVNTANIAGLPVSATLHITNIGKVALPPGTVTLSSNDYTIIGQNRFAEGVIPPRAMLDIPFTFSTKHYFSLASGTVKASMNGTTYTLPVIVLPFAGHYKRNILLPILAGMVIGILHYFGLRRNILNKRKQ